MCAHHEDDHAHEAQAALAVTPQASDAWPAGHHGAPREPGLLARAAIALVRGYQRYISAFTPPVCRFQPTCSQYTLVAIQRHGFLRGVGLGAWRILRCHPFHPGGFDPVPEAKPPRADRPPQGA